MIVMTCVKKIALVSVGGTLSELRTVKSHAKAVRFLLTVNSPKNQVSPSMGRRITDAHNEVLRKRSSIHNSLQAQQ